MDECDPTRFTPAEARGRDERSRFARYMTLALDQARAAWAWGDVPIGAVVVHGETVVAATGNRRAIDSDPVAHAELLAIRQAAQHLGDWRLNECELFVTLEPCLMCAGAIVLARMGTVVYGATDPKAGAVESLYNVLADPRLNHRPRVVNGVLAEEASQLLRDFFRAQRRLGKK